jgi:hypothetical protein
MSDTSSESDLSIDLDFEEAIMQIELLQQSYEETEARLSWIKDNVSIQIDGWDLNDILDELHSSALKEIEETGQTSFSSHVLALF